MKYLTRMKKEGGFSLVELMVAVGIIGTMSTLAVPRYQKFTANAAQSEAQSNLSAIYTLQQLYFTEQDKYSDDLTTLKYPANSNARYDYETDAFKTDGSTAGDASDSTKFHAIGTSKARLASCSLAAKDKWCVNEKKEMYNDGTKDLPCDTSDSQNGSCD